MGRNQAPGKSGQATPSRQNPLIKAVFFDAGNTLLRPYPSVGHIYANVARRHGVAEPADWVDARFREAWSRRHGLRQLARDNTEKLWWRHMVKQVWGERFPEPKFSAYFEELYGQFAHPRHWRLFRDTLPALKKLRANGLKLGIVSNWDSRLTVLAERIGLTRWMDFVLVSAVEGVVKPEPEIFRRALRHAGVRPEEALHVGDSLKEDYWGARHAGLHALLIERGGGPPPEVAAIRSLAEVATYLQRV